jgi:hypothetical protein
MKQKLHLAAVAFLALCASAYANPIVTWLEDSTGGFDLQLTGNPTSLGGGYLVVDSSTYLSPSGEWNVSFLAGSQFGFFRPAQAYMLNVSAVIGQQLVDDPFAFGTEGGYGDTVGELSYVGENLISAGLFVRPWIGLTTISFSGADFTDPSTWDYCIDVSVHRPVTAVPEGGVGVAAFALTIVGMLWFRSKTRRRKARAA